MFSSCSTINQSTIHETRYIKRWPFYSTTSKPVEYSKWNSQQSEDEKLRNPLITIPGWWLLVTPVRACALATLPGLRSWCLSWVWAPWWRPRPLIGPNLRPRALIGCQLVTPSPCQCYVNAWRWWPMRARGLIGASLGHFMAGRKLGPCQLRMGDGTFLRCRVELFIKEPLSQYAKMPVSPLKPWQTRHSWFILRVFQFMPDCLTSSR